MMKMLDAIATFFSNYSEGPHKLRGFVFASNLVE